MIEMLKKLWKNMYDYRQELSLGGIFSVSLATFNIVYTPAILPTLIVLGTLAVGTTLYFIGSFIASFFSKTKSEKKTSTDVENTEAKNADNIPSSTAKMQNQLEANKSAQIDKESINPIADGNPSREVLNPSPILRARNDAEIDRSEEERTAAMGMGGA